MVVGCNGLEPGGDLEAKMTTKFVTGQLWKRCRYYAGKSFACLHVPQGTEMLGAALFDFRHLARCNRDEPPEDRNRGTV